MTGEVPAGVLAMLYDITDDRHLPVEVRGEAAGLQYAARPRHRLSETETEVDRASDAEVLGLLRACRSARDRFIVTAMARAGLRSGEVTGLRREDIHLVPDATSLGCPVPGAHLHVRRRDNPNGAWAKSRRSRPVPVDELLVLAYDTYWFERDECRPARECDFVLVNLFREPLGAPMRPGALNELLSALSRRAGLAREIHPHMLRHGFGSNVKVGGVASDATFPGRRERPWPALRRWNPRREHARAGSKVAGDLRWHYPVASAHTTLHPDLLRPAAG